VKDDRPPSSPTLGLGIHRRQLACKQPCPGPRFLQLSVDCSNGSGSADSHLDRAWTSLANRPGGQLDVLHPLQTVGVRVSRHRGPVSRARKMADDVIEPWPVNEVCRASVTSPVLWQWAVVSLS